MFTLVDLPYSFDALEPHIDAKTMEIHHDKHHAGYTNNLNSILEKLPEWSEKRIEQILLDWESAPSEIKHSLRNNAGGYANHNLFWSIMSPKPGKASDKLVEALNQSFGSLDGMKENFTKSAIGVFGSGWTWLTFENGKLQISTTPNQDTPLMHGVKPVLGLDVWEHAYYLKYQNKRADYVAAWWNVVDWAKVSENFENTT